MRYSPSCNCCGGGGGSGCCGGGVPNGMTLQIVMSTTVEFQPAPGYTCAFECADLTGTWSLTAEAGQGCWWSYETTFDKVVGSCADGDYETWPVCFKMHYDPDVGANGTIYIWITASTCNAGLSIGSFLLLYAEGSPSGTVCSAWTSAQTMTPTAASSNCDINDVTSMTVTVV